ncbi:MAG TPA: 3-hydroxyacyl-ACP dehydratase FabZ [Stellaceae bacterium]|jgi:3-hydroxyacyl-[acyl-carrier-protein] dehydratase|nr:3-hydroxyacyl-ACP dehydratase FabZ [Stellaceae bacterium]
METTDTQEKPHVTAEIDLKRIMQMIPHRYPFLMIDKVINVVRGVSAIGIKSVTVNEPHFQGHFPRWPVMPGVLIIEAMAQTAAVFVVDAIGDQAAGKLVYFTSIDSARFRRPVVPGSTLELHVERVHSRGTVWKFAGKAMVDGKLMAEATYAAMIMDNNINNDE